MPLMFIELGLGYGMLFIITYGVASSYSSFVRNYHHQNVARNKRNPNQFLNIKTANEQIINKKTSSRVKNKKGIVHFAESNTTDGILDSGEIGNIWLFLEHVNYIIEQCLIIKIGSISLNIVIGNKDIKLLIKEDNLETLIITTLICLAISIIFKNGFQVNMFGIKLSFSRFCAFLEYIFIVSIVCIIIAECYIHCSKFGFSNIQVVKNDPILSIFTLYGFSLTDVDLSSFEIAVSNSISMVIFTVVGIMGALVFTSTQCNMPHLQISRVAYFILFVNSSLRYGETQNHLLNSLSESYRRFKNRKNHDDCNVREKIGALYERKSFSDAYNENPSNCAKSSNDIEMPILALSKLKFGNDRHISEFYNKIYDECEPVEVFYPSRLKEKPIKTFMTVIYNLILALIYFFLAYSLNSYKYARIFYFLTGHQLILLYPIYVHWKSLRMRCLAIINILLIFANVYMCLSTLLPDMLVLWNAIC